MVERIPCQVGTMKSNLRLDLTVSIWEKVAGFLLYVWSTSSALQAMATKSVLSQLSFDRQQIKQYVESG